MNVLEVTESKFKKEAKLNLNGIINFEEFSSALVMTCKRIH